MRWNKKALAVVVLAALAALPLPASAQTASRTDTRFVAVIDAAHGGNDPGGTLANGQPEKSATLAFSVRLRSLLNARGITVITTRESDTTLDADARAAIANHAQAQLCLSLHITEAGQGVHLFTSSLAPAQRARYTAWKTAQAAWVTRSLALAGALNSALQHAGFPVTLGRTSLPGIDSMTCPAVAVELAPARDADRNITAQPYDRAYQTKAASALAAAVLAWRSEARHP